jgi:hypothetical protein
MYTKQPIEPHQTHDTQLVLRPPVTPSQLVQDPQEKRHGFRRLRTRTSQGSRQSETIIISCECGSKETSNVFQCHSCNGWQHAQCYAYDGPDDIRMPPERKCYTCLMGKASDHPLDEARTVTRTRQVIYCIQVRGLTSSTQIARTLGERRQAKFGDEN